MDAELFTFVELLEFELLDAGIEYWTGTTGLGVAGFLGVTLSEFQKKAQNMRRQLLLEQQPQHQLVLFFPSLLLNPYLTLIYFNDSSFECYDIWTVPLTFCT